MKPDESNVYLVFSTIIRRLRSRLQSDLHAHGMSGSQHPRATEMPFVTQKLRILWRKFGDLPT